MKKIRLIVSTLLTVILFGNGCNTAQPEYISYKGFNTGVSENEIISFIHADDFIRRNFLMENCEKWELESLDLLNPLSPWSRFSIGIVKERVSEILGGAENIRLSDWEKVKNDFLSNFGEPSGTIKKNSMEIYWWGKIRFSKDIFFEIEEVKGKSVWLEWSEIPTGPNKGDNSLLFGMYDEFKPKRLPVSSGTVRRHLPVEVMDTNLSKEQKELIYSKTDFQIRELLERGLVPLELEEKYHLAIEEENLDKVKCLLDIGIGTNWLISYDDHYTEGNPLRSAALAGNIEMVKLLIKYDAKTQSATKMRIEAKIGLSTFPDQPKIDPIQLENYKLILELLTSD